MSEQALFVLANDTLAAVISQIGEEQMHLLVPTELNWRPNLTLRRTMNLYAYENLCVPKVLDGEAGLQTNDEFQGDLLGDAPQQNYKRYHDAANEAARRLDDTERTVHISYGDCPARMYLRDISVQRGLGAHDLAKFTGASTELPPELVQGLWDAVLPIVDLVRAAGVFRPEVSVPETAPLQARLLGLTGRQP